jgi:hypothetical protein
MWGAGPQHQYCTHGEMTPHLMLVPWAIVLTSVEMTPHLIMLVQFHAHRVCGTTTTSKPARGMVGTTPSKDGDKRNARRGKTDAFRGLSGCFCGAKQMHSAAHREAGRGSARRVSHLALADVACAHEDALAAPALGEGVTDLDRCAELGTHGASVAGLAEAQRECVGARRTAAHAHTHPQAHPRAGRCTARACALLCV